MNPVDMTTETLRQQAKQIKADGCRFVTVTCLEETEDTLALIYHFEKNLELFHYRVRIPKDKVVPSLCPVFSAAFLVENEIRDQFGVTFEDLEPDFNGTLYFGDSDVVTATPFCRFGVKRADG
ncbi:MAG: NADH-quinone oxidoreductase subunit C [Desulfarculaceae bacterium]|nr:NADH-quinone oxidoreductase subunit C [Desulfarculaceae bacterium]